MTRSDTDQLGLTLRRTVSPISKVYVLPSLHAVVLNAAPDQLPIAQQTVSQLVPSWSPTDPNAASPVYGDPTRGNYSADVTEQTFYLPTQTDGKASNEVLVALRNAMSPQAKIYLVASRSALVITASPNELQLAQKILADLNHKQPSV